jgi:hypothetical protein
VVRFNKDLVLGTGKEGAPVAKKPVVFRQDETGFVRVTGGEEGATAALNAASGSVNPTPTDNGDSRVTLALVGLSR